MWFFEAKQKLTDQTPFLRQSHVSFLVADWSVQPRFYRREQLNTAHCEKLTVDKRGGCAGDSVDQAVVVILSRSNRSRSSRSPEHDDASADPPVCLDRYKGDGASPRT